MKHRVQITAEGDFTREDMHATVADLLQETKGHEVAENCEFTLEEIGTLENEEIINMVMKFLDASYYNRTADDQLWPIIEPLGANMLNNLIFVDSLRRSPEAGIGNAETADVAVTHYSRLMRQRYGR